jgi:putative ABC transport system permease protein
VPVTFADGKTVRMSVGTVYRPISTLGDYVLPEEVWTAHNPNPLVDQVFVALRPGADRVAVTDAVAGIARHYGGLTVRDRAGYLDDTASAVGTILNIVYLMLALAIVIALLGIGNTLGLAVHERTREIGLLRAVGASRRQVRAALRWEAVLTAVLGTGSGAGLGLFLGWALATAISAAEQTGQVVIPWPRVAVVLVAGGLAGLLAGTRPARRAGRHGPLDGLAAG